MAKREVIWRQRPSQLSNFWTYVLFFWTLIIPLIVFMRNRFTVYELTHDRFFDKKGILFQRINQLELIRIRDYEVSRSLMQRIFGKGNLMLVTRDVTTPVVVLRWISDPEEASEIIRDASEKSKSSRGFREAEVY